jgi:hypothetical protein
MDSGNPKDAWRRLSWRRPSAQVSDESLVSTDRSSDRSSPEKLQPRSEYLRRALQDRKQSKEQPLPPPSLQSPASFRSAAEQRIDSVGDSTNHESDGEETGSISPQLPSPEPSVYAEDPFMEEAAKFDNRSPRKPLSRSSTGRPRPSASPCPPTPSRDIQGRLDQLSSENWSLKHKIALQQERASALERRLEQALDELKVLKSVREENTKLQGEKELLAKDNTWLEEKVVELEEDINLLQSAHDEQQKRIETLAVENEMNSKNCIEWMMINEELAKQQQLKDEGLEEAADIIYNLEEKTHKLEDERSILLKKLQELQKQISQTSCSKPQDLDYHGNDFAPGSPRLKPREKTASTESTFSICQHSDYFSGPNSPSVASSSSPKKGNNNNNNNMPSPVKLTLRKKPPLVVANNARSLARIKSFAADRMAELKSKTPASSVVDLADYIPTSEIPALPLVPNQTIVKESEKKETSNANVQLHRQQQQQRHTRGTPVKQGLRSQYMNGAQEIGHPKNLRLRQRNEDHLHVTDSEGYASGMESGIDVGYTVPSTKGSIDTRLSTGVASNQARSFVRPPPPPVYTRRNSTPQAFNSYSVSEDDSHDDDNNKYHHMASSWHIQQTKRGQTPQTPTVSVANPPMRDMMFNSFSEDFGASMRSAARSPPRPRTSSRAKRYEDEA